MMDKMTVRDVDVTGKRVLVRVDFNVPLDKQTGEITDDNRIQAAVPTIEYLIDHGAKVILASHLGRPDGRVEENMRLAVVARRLSQVLGKPVEATSDCIGTEADRAVASLKNGDVLLLENLRFYPGEEKNAPAFVEALAKLADIYVDDAFGTAHRSHASIVGVAKLMPAVAGLLLEKELVHLGGILEKPAHPFAALLGGAKVSDKVAMIENIMAKVDCLLIGGGMAATFLQVLKYEIGLSLIEKDLLDTTAHLIEQAKEKNIALLLPVDVVISSELSADARVEVVSVENITPDMRIADIGPQTIKNFGDELLKCRVVFWNGPMGVYEIPQFAEGTQAMVNLLAGSQAQTIIGGGSTAEAVAEMGMADKMTFVSTGGGASLQFLSGKTLPGVAVLLDKK